MLICDRIYNMNPEQTPQTPDDASEIYESLDDRDEQRKRAVDIARKRADAATTEEDKVYFKSLADTMSDERFQFREFFPGVFDD